MTTGLSIHAKLTTRLSVAARGIPTWSVGRYGALTRPHRAHARDEDAVTLSPKKHAFPGELDGYPHRRSNHGASLRPARRTARAMARIQRGRTSTGTVRSRHVDRRRRDGRRARQC